MKKQNEEFVNEQSATSQKAKILEHLKKGLTITPLEALKLCGCFRLSARIYDLKDDGYDISTIIAIVNGKRVAQYKLEQ